MIDLSGFRSDKYDDVDPVGRWMIDDDRRFDKFVRATLKRMRWQKRIQRVVLFCFGWLLRIMRRRADTAKLAKRIKSGDRAMMYAYGPLFQWFAWHPVWTRDRGWSWLRRVWRAREYLTLSSPSGAPTGWVNYCEKPERIY